MIKVRPINKIKLSAELIEKNCGKKAKLLITSCPSNDEIKGYKRPIDNVSSSVEIIMKQPRKNIFLCSLLFKTHQIFLADSIIFSLLMLLERLNTLPRNWIKVFR